MIHGLLSTALAALPWWGTAAVDYTGDLAEVEAILNTNPQIEGRLARELHQESVRLRGFEKALQENCPIDGTGDADRDLRCGMVMGASIQSREKLLADVRAVAAGIYEEPKEFEDPRRAIARRFDDRSYAENAVVECDW